MAWLTLLPVTLLCSVGAWLTYAGRWKGEWWYPWAFAGLAAAVGWLYGWAMRHAANDRDAFALSFVWDVAVTAIYVVVPCLLFGVRVSPLGWCGLAVAAVGVVMLKLGAG
jgi:hypothetical protein